MLNISIVALSALQGERERWEGEVGTGRRKRRLRVLPSSAGAQGLPVRRRGAADKPTAENASLPLMASGASEMHPLVAGKPCGSTMKSGHSARR